MNPLWPNGPRPSPLDSIRRLARPRDDRERCDLCSAELAEEHAHLVDPSDRRLVCACEPCAILFGHRAAAKYRRVPRELRYLAGFRLTDLQWEGLGLPIRLAFFLHSTPAGGVVALYPSPAGATASAVPPEAWQALVDDNPVLRELEPDVEALLAYRVGDARDHYRVGIDQCYKLAGLLRTHWRGFSGGTAVWEEVGRFFGGLKQRAGAAHA